MQQHVDCVGYLKPSVSTTDCYDTGNTETLHVSSVTFWRCNKRKQDKRVRSPRRLNQH